MSLSRTIMILAAVALLALAGCGGGGEEDGGGEGTEQADALVFETNHGTFTVTLDRKTSPNVSTSMIKRARQGFFDGTICHRIVPGFVIQCGDPTGTGEGGPGYSTHDEVPADARYTKGVVAMAKTQTEPAGTAGSQFFVVTGEDVGLPPEYAILGTVTEGLDVIERIGELGDPTTEEPTEEVRIERATARESG